MRMMLIAVLTLGMAQGLRGEAPAERVHEVAVVRTWGELEAQPEIEVAEGLTVRLGIQARERAVYDGVLIYCLVNDVSKVKVPSTLEVLGPLKVEVIQAKPEQHVAEAVVERHINIPLLRASPALFIYGVAMHVAGAEYEIILKYEGDRRVARASVKASEETAHPWLRFGPPRKLQQMRERRPDDRAEDLFVTHFGMPDGMRALPKWEGEMPLVILTDDRRPAAEDPLPTMVPPRVDEKLVLRREGNVLQITSDRELEADRMMEDQWLARWWVNGEPVKGADEPPGLERGLMMLHLTRHIDIELEFDPAAIGAKAGDRIGLQLLYCENGWELVGDQMEMLVMNATMRPESGPPVRMTNRIEFVAPEANR